jgi:hypothetical protein
LSIKNLSSVLEEFDAIPSGAKSLFWDSMREAGEIVARDLSAKAPKDKGRLAASFDVWQAKKLSRRYRQVIFRVGLKTNYFYTTLAKGKKAHVRNGKPVKKSGASHPEWKLPGDDEAARSRLLGLTVTIFNGKVRSVDQMIGRGKRRR